MAQVLTNIVEAVNITARTPVSFASAFTSSTLPNDIYNGIDFASLSYAEQLWARWYTWIGDPVLATGIMSFVLHEVSRAFSVVLICSMPRSGRLLWPLLAVGGRRPHLLLQQVENPRGAISHSLPSALTSLCSQTKKPTWQQQWDCTKYVLYTHVRPRFLTFMRC